MQTIYKGWLRIVQISAALGLAQMTIGADLASKVPSLPIPAAPSAVSVDSSPSMRINQMSVFDTPLFATSAPTDTESLVLIDSLEKFRARAVRDDFSELENFLRNFPDSAWAISLRTVLGGEYYRTGHYSKAIDSYKAAWELGKGFTNEVPVSLANEAVAELGLMYARLGRMEEIAQLLAEVEGRVFRGAAAAHIQGARDGLWSMEHRPGTSFRCGPLALDRICAATDRPKAGNQLIQDAQSTTNGFSAREVAELSRKLGMNYQVAFREPGAQIILPSVVHWKVGHYAALISRDGALLRAEDATFRNKVWLSDSTLDDEASGYFLIGSGPLPAGWRAVSDDEADHVWGKGTTNVSDPDSTTPYDEKAKPPCESHGMPTWNVHLLLASQIIEDTPVGYTPPVGPPINFTVTYNSADAQGREGVAYSNVSPDWRCNWLAYVTDDPMNPAGDVRFAVDGGGTLTFTDYNPTNQIFSNLIRNRANLVRTGTNSYEVRYPDGSKKIFDLPGSLGGTTRKIFMTAVVDPAGNAATIQFDSPGRITSITDAIGQQTKLYYEVTNSMVFEQWKFVQTYLITRVVDPFGRTAKFHPSEAVFPHLASIVDSLGLSSSFEEFAKDKVGWWIRDMKTPYGTTHFEADSSNFLRRANWLEITNPDGNKERVEYSEEASGFLSSDPLAIVPKGVPVRNVILWARNSYYWDRKAYAESFSKNFQGYAHAKIYHFTHGQDYSTASPILESYKAPLESRIWYNYAGQVNPTFIGTSDRPTKVSRVLDDGRTQLYQFEYNKLNNPTKTIDPAGRTLTMAYETNEVDMREIRQTRAGQNELLFKATYNSQHLPLTITEASGQTTLFTYNARGQVLTATNPRGEQEQFLYDSSGYLIAINGPLPGPSDTSRFSYDSAGRLQTATDPDGYQLNFAYDDLDRVTRVTYPDNSFESIVYKLLDPEILTDRAGRQTHLTYDSLRQLTAVQDAFGRVTRYQWCGCGGLERVIDAMGRATSWIRDVQGRVVAKIDPGGEQVSYDYELATGNLKSIRDAKNQITLFRYNIDNTLREKNYLNSGGPMAAVRFTHDPDYPRILTMTDGTGLTTYSYYPVSAAPATGAGRLATIDGPLPNDTVTFAYDSLGRVEGRAINGVGIQRSWDALGRLTHLTNVLGAFSYGWEGASFRLSTLDLPNGQRSSFTYFNNQKDHLLKEITHFKSDNAIFSRFVYDYNILHQITDWTQLQGGNTRLWAPGYDSAERLTGVSESGASARSFDYVYDNVENRLQEREGSTTRQAAYNVNNQLTSINDSAIAAVNYDWDVENRLAAVTKGSHRTEFAYDGFGRRTRIVEKDNGTVLTDRHFVWIGLDLCEEREADGTKVLKRFSVHGVRAETGADVPAGSYFYARDHLDSIREMTDGNGLIRASYDYSPYGTRTRTSGDLESDFGFTGHYAHAPSGLNLAAYRDYDPNLGRWLSRDPLGESGSLNLYSYALNDPVNYVDPLGLSAANKLGANLQGQKDAQAGVDAYNKGKAALDTLDTIADKGLSKTALDAANKEAEETFKQFNARDEYKRANETMAKNAQEGSQTYANPLRAAYETAKDALMGKQPCAQTGPAPKSDTPPEEPDWIDRFKNWVSGSSKPAVTPKSAPSSSHFNPSAGY
jgi:RHS repeat-associated protein